MPKKPVKPERKSRMTQEALDELVRRSKAGEDMRGPFVMAVWDGCNLYDCLGTGLTAAALGALLGLLSIYSVLTG